MTKIKNVITWPTIAAAATTAIAWVTDTHPAVRLFCTTVLAFTLVLDLTRQARYTRRAAKAD